ncbi:sensor histidine kinase [bacterium]|nr:sensor histidine kinase [bacterium]
MNDAPPAIGGAPASAPSGFRTAFFSGLRGRLLLLTACFVLLAEIVIWPITASNYRDQWLGERVQAAQIAALAIEAAPDGRVSDELSSDLLMEAQLIAIVAVGADSRELILGPSMAIDGALVPVDLRSETMAMSVVRAVSIFFAPRGRFLQITAQPMMTGDPELEVILPESALRKDLRRYSLEILAFSLAVSALAGLLIYFALSRLVVGPIRDITENVLGFAAHPEAGPVQVKPASVEEIRRTQVALNDMQRAVSASIRQRKRLAELGEAVAKINHDLRNSLAAAQLVTEGLSRSDDPRVQRAAPRLERAIERAIGLAEATLRYGRADPPAPQIQTVRLAPVLEEAAQEALAGWPQIESRVSCDPGLAARVDPDQLHRIVVNLMRNAARAIEEQGERTSAGRVTVSAAAESGVVSVEIADNGPGVPANIVSRLFQPFSGTTSRDGSGLGLAIARELARGMKGDLILKESGPSGAVFRLVAPAG